MPFKSKAQRRKFAELLVKGEITPEQFEEWNRSTGSKELPERVRPKGGAKKKRAVKKKPAPKAKRVATPRRGAAGKRTARSKRAAKTKRP